MQEVKVNVVNIIKPRVELVLTWGSEELVAAMTDVVYRAYSIEDALRRVRERPELVARRITGFLRDGHHSVLEFMGASWLVEGSRAFTHELVRHRVASYWQESQRYVDYTKGQLRYVLPPSLASQWAGHLDGVSQAYVKAREGFAPEDARYLLPNAMASRVWVQMNAREFFLNFMPLRTGLGAFHEIRLIAWLMFDSLVDRFPIIARWVWDNLPRLHSDYCRGVERLSSVYGTSDCRVVSIRDAFSKWGVEIPRGLAILINQP
ncbi:FAD-dependent thymidylate synthase [Vulcanisaeta souniana]|uniref:FAD-dependent thymidylate synthase n=1 Tax=Vulcanisaeta souniana JCM 11219 TaxID=1293586 RepID=A0A830ECL1_9CREN|nr:FAD-dependent thymidylate synthase [Vulcanisaeta souniana]BDR91639.1 thymidylate synthase [Vulcanisaeta souniana JCM 11219]GGI71693.1 thymidylate synthase [Vulcanisaeta souniana JCM 11219]